MISTDRVHDVLKTVLAPTQPIEAVDLIETGIMDSLSLVSVIMELETTFNINIPFEKLEIDNFRTLDSISQFISKEAQMPS